MDWPTSLYSFDYCHPIYRDISSNSLSGNVPVSLGKLDKLISLWVAPFFLLPVILVILCGSSICIWICFMNLTLLKFWCFEAMCQTIFLLDQYQLTVCLEALQRARKYSNAHTHTHTHFFCVCWIITISKDNRSHQWLWF